MPFSMTAPAPLNTPLNVIVPAVLVAVRMLLLLPKDPVPLNVKLLVPPNVAVSLLPIA